MKIYIPKVLYTMISNMQSTNNILKYLTRSFDNTMNLENIVYMQKP